MKHPTVSLQTFKMTHKLVNEASFLTFRRVVSNVCVGDSIDTLNNFTYDIKRAPKRCNTTTERCKLTVGKCLQKDRPAKASEACESFLFMCPGKQEKGDLLKHVQT